MDAVTALAKKHTSSSSKIAPNRMAPPSTARWSVASATPVASAFSPAKNLGAHGDAGGMITYDEKIAENARMIAQHGQSKAKHDHKIEGRNSASTSSKPRFSVRNYPASKLGQKIAARTPPFTANSSKAPDSNCKPSAPTPATFTTSS